MMIDRTSSIPTFVTDPMTGRAGVVTGDSLAAIMVSPTFTRGPREPELVASAGSRGALYKPQPVKTYPKRQAPIVRHRRPRRGKRKATIGAWMRATIAGIARHWPWS